MKKIPRAPHRWAVTPKEAIAIQKRLASQVSDKRPAGEFRLVAGVDAAYSRDGARCIAAAVLWDLRTRSVLEQQTATRKLTFPYVPGLLSFRETPAVLAALRKLSITPDVVMFDGHGLAHPRRFGIACHAGVLLDMPTLGCGKSRLVGEHDEPALKRGSKRRLTHKGEVIGSVLRTRDAVRPIYVSIGHRMDLASAERLVLACNGGYRLPQPTRLADQLVAVAKRALPGLDLA